MCPAGLGGWKAAVEVRVRASVTLRFEDARTARAVARATEVDNPARGVEQALAGRVVEFNLDPAAPRSLRESLDDWLRCAAAAAESARRAR